MESVKMRPGAGYRPRLLRLLLDPELGRQTLRDDRVTQLELVTNV